MLNSRKCAFKQIVFSRTCDFSKLWFLKKATSRNVDFSRVCFSNLWFLKMVIFQTCDFSTWRFLEKVIYQKGDFSKLWFLKILAGTTNCNEHYCPGGVLRQAETTEPNYCYTCLCCCAYFRNASGPRCCVSYIAGAPPYPPTLLDVFSVLLCILSECVQSLSAVSLWVSCGPWGPQEKTVKRKRHKYTVGILILVSRRNSLLRKSNNLAKAPRGEKAPSSRHE